MEDIGEAVGITASAIYRHYDSKTAVLVAMFDRVIDQLLSEGQQLVADPHADPREALTRLIEGQIGFVVDDRDVAQVYFREIANLPEADRRNLRRKQRLYLEEWVHLLTELRGDLDDNAARDAGALRDRRDPVHPAALGRAARGPAAGAAAPLGAGGPHRRAVARSERDRSS